MHRLRWLIVCQAAAAISMATVTWARLAEPGRAAESPRRVDLHDKDLSGTNLACAGLEGAQLARAVLTEAMLLGANLGMANLSGADLQGADLQLANLSGADLRGASLRGALLQRASLDLARLDRADLTGALYDRYTSWPDGFDPQGHGATLVEPDETLRILPCGAVRPTRVL